ncbi:MAG: ROK family transcriptional regulator [Marinomonas sp.]
MNRNTCDELVMSANERMILDIIRRYSGIPRSGIAPHTNLTQQAVHRIIDTLISKDFVQLGGSLVSGRGKPSPSLTLNPTAFFSIGISLNTDDILVNLINFSGQIVDEKYAPFNPTERSKTLVWIKEVIDEWQVNQPDISRKIVGVGFAMSGYFIKKTGVICPPKPLKDWSEINLLNQLETVLQRKIWFVNNATTGAIGEALYGAGLKHNIFGYLSFNFGFGAGVVIEGKPLFGAFGNAGEIGRIYRPEEVSDRPALGELLKVLHSNGIDISSVSELRKSFDPDWPGVKDWVVRVTPHLVRAVNGLRAVIDPSAIVLGGEIPKALGLLLIQSLENFYAEVKYDISPHPEIILSVIDYDPAAFGAALLPLRDTFF